MFNSPMRRARETADIIASAIGLSVSEDARLRERMNWDGRQPGNSAAQAAGGRLVPMQAKGLRARLVLSRA
ncbi:histidine phosphatase family protein [Nonomuraea recticatena]|uniref:Uncharacterized protein n=1 Tax=Nonomuraea recticatena TaxID=46178 RepID=A0ABP6FX21_9ACTN